MINDPNYNLPKDAFIRLFDNPIPAGDPARSDAPEWAQELDEVVVWAHMGDNGQVSVKVNGEDIGGGGGGEGIQTAILTMPSDVSPNLVTIVNGPEGIGEMVISGSEEGEHTFKIPVPLKFVVPARAVIEEITGSYTQVDDNTYILTGDCSITMIS